MKDGSKLRRQRDGRDAKTTDSFEPSPGKQSRSHRDYANVTAPQPRPVRGVGTPAVVAARAMPGYPDIFGGMLAPTRGHGDTTRTFARATSGSPDQLPYRAQMEGLFGESLGGVQAYTGRTELSAIGARGAAMGDKIAFAPSSPDAGLVAHELTHVLQQRRASAPSFAAKPLVSQTSDAAEQEADSVADRVETQGFAGAPVRVSASPAAMLHLDRGRPSGKSTQQQPDANTSLAEDLRTARRSYWQVNLHTVRYLQAASAVIPIMVRAYGGVIVAQLSLMRSSLSDAKAKLGSATSAERASYAKLRKRTLQLERDLPVKLGPHMFDGKLVPGSVARFSPAQVEAGLKHSVRTTADLLRSIRVAERILRAGFTAVSARRAVDTLQSAGNTPAKMRFLDLALHKIGYAKFLYGIPGSPSKGKKHGETLRTSAFAARDALGGTPRTVDGLFQRLDQARAFFISDPPDYKRCAYTVQQAHDALQHFTSGKNARRLKSADTFSQMAKGSSSITGQLLYLAREGKRGGPDRAHLWDFYVSQLRPFTEALEIMAGEIPYAGSGLAKVNHIRRNVSIGTAAVMMLPFGGALFADVIVSAPFLGAMAQRVGASSAAVWPAIKVWALSEPQAAAAVATLITSIGIDIAEVGGIENYLRMVTTKEGSLMLAMDLVDTWMAMGGGHGGEEAPHPSSRPKSKTFRKSIRAQKQALVKKALERLAAAKEKIVKLYHDHVPQSASAAREGVRREAPEHQSAHNHERQQVRKRGRRLRTGVRRATRATRRRAQYRAKINDTNRAILQKRLRVPIRENAKLAGNAVHVHYEVDAKTGRVTITHIEHGTNATFGRVLEHRRSMKRMRQYNGLIGRLRRVWHRVHGRQNPFDPRAQRAHWEAWQEIHKLDDIIKASNKRLVHATKNAARAIKHELAILRAVRRKFERIERLAVQERAHRRRYVGSPNTDPRRGSGLLPRKRRKQLGRKLTNRTATKAEYREFKRDQRIRRSGSKHERIDRGARAPKGLKGKPWKRDAYHGRKPTYVNPGHHDPRSPNFRGRGATTTPLPDDAAEVYRTAIPDPKDPRTWYGRNANGDYYRYQGNNNEVHWNGSTASERGLQVPTRIKRRFDREQ